MNVPRVALVMTGVIPFSSNSNFSRARGKSLARYFSGPFAEMGLQLKIIARKFFNFKPQRLRPILAHVVSRPAPALITASLEVAVIFGSTSDLKQDSIWQS